MSMSNSSHLSREERRHLLKPLLPMNQSIDLESKTSYHGCNSLCQYLKKCDLHKLQEPEMPEYSEDEHESHQGKGTVTNAFHTSCVDAFLPCSGALEDCISRTHPELYKDAIDMIWSENVFVINLENIYTANVILDEHVLDSLDPSSLSKIRYLSFWLDLRHQYEDEGWDVYDESLQMLIIWKTIMEGLREVLSWDQLHLNLIFELGDPTSVVFITNVVRSFPRVGSCGISLRSTSESLFRKEVMKLTRDITYPKMHHPDAGTFHHEFKFYNALPKELRLLVLSFVGLAPCEDYQGDTTWLLCGTQWQTNENCCGVCGGGRDSLLCCCKWRRNTYSTSCRCNDPFWPILGASKQLRAEALSILFTNRFKISSADAEFSESTFFNSMKQFLNWKPTIWHLSLMKDVRLYFGLSELDTWHDDQVKFNTELTEILRIFVKYTKPNNIVTLDLKRLKMPYDEHWNGYGWRRLQLFQDDLCTILKQLYTAYPLGCKVFIDWTKSRPWQCEDSEASERDAKAREAETIPLIDEETGQRMWRKSDWVKYAPIKMSMKWPDYGPSDDFVQDDWDD